MAAKGPIERALIKLQAAIREGPGDGDRFPGRSGQVPKDLQTAEVKVLAINARDEALREAVAALLLGDERFEHMKQRGADDATWRFVCLAFLERSANHVPAFMQEHAHAPGEHTCVQQVFSGSNAQAIDAVLFKQDRGEADRVTPIVGHLSSLIHSPDGKGGLSRTQTVDGSTGTRSPCKASDSRAPLERTGAELLSNHCPKYGPEADALADGATRKSRSWSDL